MLISVTAAAVGNLVAEAVAVAYSSELGMRNKKRPFRPFTGQCLCLSLHPSQLPAAADEESQGRLYDEVDQVG